MTKDEALDLALEALEGLKSIPGGRHELHELNAIHRKHDRAITAIKQALAAQPAVPDAIQHTDLSEHPQYIEGWNDCRAEMLKGMKL
jgi:hypothetical protein